MFPGLNKSREACSTEAFVSITQKVQDMLLANYRNYTANSYVSTKYTWHVTQSYNRHQNNYKRDV